ncbi:VOC family protein [Albidovulum sediminis]|uniref:VOC family protein n=1 Tax=Albidovulum sediminis TaxID=3066345 RepID=A0ABT2NKU9_9RHOB|nr:VOC family protein [Defluviimonas sediminis]MCT8328708.1 VOC family protein [Defluviimonas sediminis]
MTAPEILGTLESALYAPDLDAAEAFFAGTLGMRVIARQPGRHVFFAAGDSVLLVFDPDATAAGSPAGARLPVPGHGARGPGHYCFRVAAGALDAWRRHLEAHDIAIEADFTWPNGARSIYVRDPAGNSVEFAPSVLWFRPLSDGGREP